MGAGPNKVFRVSHRDTEKAKLEVTYSINKTEEKIGMTCTCVWRH